MKITGTIPDYLLGKHQLTATVVFTVLFSLVFLIVSIPFSDRGWFALEGSQLFYYTLAFFVVAILVLIISRRLLYITKHFTHMTVLRYIIWCFMEIALIDAIYTFFTVQGENLGIIPQIASDHWRIYLGSLVSITLSMGVPYVVSALYFALADRDKTISLMSYANVVNDEAPSVQDQQRITLYDNSGVMKLSVNADNLLYLESDDNYIKVWYLDSSQTLKQYMLRCRIKTVESSFEGSPLIRCHRQYMVNMRRVNALTKERDGYYLQLDMENIDPVPVSKTYEQKILNHFNSK